MFDEFIAPGVPVPLFWLCAGLGVVIQGVSKSGFAGGAGILAIPLMMLVMPVETVMATLLPLLILMDLNAIYHHRRNRAWPVVFEVFVPSVIGIAIAGAIWWWIGKSGIDRYAGALKRMVGVICLLFAFYIVGKERAMDWVRHVQPGRKSAWAAGLSAGFVSTLTHAAGPIISLYVYTLGMGKALFVGTVAWTFTLVNLAKLPVFMASGLLRKDVLLFDACLVWLVPVGSWLGKWMHDRVSEKLFNRVVCVLVFLAGVQLILNVDIVGGMLKAIAPVEAPPPGEP